MLNLMVHSSRFLGNISTVLRLEVLSIFKNLLRRSVPHQNLEGLVLLRLPFKSIGTVLLPKFFNELRLFLEPNTNRTRHRRSTDDHLGNPDRLQSSLMTDDIWIHTTTSDTIRKGIVSILKLLTENFLIQNSQPDRLEETLTIQFESTTKVEILYERKINIMTKHLRSKNTHIKL